MIRRDYLVKQLEEFGKVIARLFLLRKNRDFTNLQREIDDAALQFIRMNMESLEKMDGDALTQLAIGLEDHELRMAADLLYEKLQLYLNTEQMSNVADMKFRCIKLYELVKARNPQSFDMTVYHNIDVLKGL